MADETSSATAGRAARRSGPGRVLIAVYGVFALAATSRAGVQIATNFHEAPTAYLLSAFAAVVYIVATVTLARSGRVSHRIAVTSCTIELIGVIAVGTYSLTDKAAFPDATVWSGYGNGYGYVPLVLPVLGLLWLRHTRRRIPAADRT
jgi:cytochrome bd-type quinol oxidase subunit 2